MRVVGVLIGRDRRIGKEMAASLARLKATAEAASRELSEVDGATAAA